jgi:FMN phosphatase YigB (HAD superfamily)
MNDTAGCGFDGEIEFVYFDLGNVLLSFDPQRACQNVARRFDVSPQAAHGAIYDSGLQHRFERGEVDGAVFAEEVRTRLELRSDQMPGSELLDAVSDMFTPVDSMPEILQAVRDAGVPVGLLSNTCHAHWDWIRRQRYPATEFLFDVTILSYEVGAMKPDPLIYEVAEAASEVPFDRILFLDDRAENVSGALQRRWRAVECVGGPPSWQVLRQHRVIQ